MYMTILLQYPLLKLHQVVRLTSPTYSFEGSLATKPQISTIGPSDVTQPSNSEICMAEAFGALAREDATIGRACNAYMSISGSGGGFGFGTGGALVPYLARRSFARSLYTSCKTKTEEKSFNTSV